MPTLGTTFMYIIYTDTQVFLSKKTYISWHEIQLEYENYKASLGPWSIEEVTDFLNNEYLDLEPSAIEQVMFFTNSSLSTYELIFSLGK